MKIYIGAKSSVESQVKKIEHKIPKIFHLKWIPLANGKDIAPNIPGIYMLAFDKPIKYDKGISRVTYIGSSIRLKERLRSQYRKIQSGFLIDVTKGDMSKIFSCFFEVEVESREEILTVEQLVLDEFVNKFGVQPLGNWFPKTTDLLGEILIGEQIKKPKEYLSFMEDYSLEPALTFDAIADNYELEYKRDELSPRIMFYPKGTFAKFKIRKKERELRKLTEISMNHIPCWDKDKILSLLKIAMILKEDKTKKLRSTRRFLSDTFDIPKPHTWGEVAIVLARHLAGTWYPKKRMFVEIKFNSQLLGKAIIRKSGCVGSDIANIPQRNSTRRFWFCQFDEVDTIASKLAWECHEKGKKLPKDAIGGIFESGDSFFFKLFDRVVKQREEDFKKIPEKVFERALAEIKD